MSAPQEVFEELKRDLLAAKTVEEKDALLDEWFDCANRATDYDATNWGLDPRRWMSEARKEMEDNIADEMAISRGSKPRTRPKRTPGMGPLL